MLRHAVIAGLLSSGCSVAELASVSQIADHALPFWIEYPIHHFKRKLANQDRTILRKFRDVANAIAALQN
jgi:hypothetical protein